MNGGYESRKVLKSGLTQTVAASQTDAVLSSEFKISASGSCRFRVDAVVSAAVAGGGITMKLQHATFVNADGTATWTDTKTAAITTTGIATIKLLVEDEDDIDHLPLRPNGRIVVTTGGSGATVTITDLRVIQEV